MLLVTSLPKEINKNNERKSKVIIINYMKALIN